MKLLVPRVPSSFASVLLLGLAVTGCPTGGSSIGELEEGSASSSSGSGSGSDGDESTTASPGTDGSTGEAATGSTGEPPLACPEWSQCSVALECAPEGFEECGGILGRSDANGCPRQPCRGPGECPAGTSCFLPWSWASCGYHGCSDDPRTGTCECGFGLDCNNDGLCIPDEEGLPPDTNGPEFCGQHRDAASCEGSLPAELGACRWYEGWQMPAGAACEERVEIAQCVFISAFQDGWESLTSCPTDETLTPMVLDEDGQLTVLLVDPDDQPATLEQSSWGWSPCDIAGTQAECECGCP